MISVVVPNLNEEKHLPQFLESLNQQTCSYFQLIVVDGGSTDESSRILMQFQNRFPMTIHVDGTRNIGYIRNLGSKLAAGDILLHTNSDCYLPSTLLEDISRIYDRDPSLVSLCGRTRPLNCSTFCSLSYISYDFLRWFFTRLRRFRPGGSFFSIRVQQFWELGGFPEVGINEDGHLGRLIDRQNWKCVFNTQLWIGHSPAKRWKDSGLRGFSHYTYVFGNFLNLRVFQSLEEHAAHRFQQKRELT